MTRKRVIGSDTDTAVTGIVLAGGESARFDNGDKALATVGGRTILERVVDALRTATDRPPVVAVRTESQRTRYEATLARRDVEFATDVPDFDGPLAGLLGAVESDAASTPWVFVCGCDMPLLSPTTVDWLFAQLPDDDLDIDAICVRHPDGTCEPLHAVYRRGAIEDVRDRLPRSGGVRSVLTACDRVRAVPLTTAPKRIRLADSLWNVNTRDDLAIARERLRARDVE